MKYCFFDVDGTLFPFGKDATEITKEALKKAHENNHKLFISTGRSPAEMDSRINSLPFDGGIFCGGALAMIKDKVIFNQFFTKEQIEFITSYAKKRGYYLLFQTTRCSYLTQEMSDALLKLFNDSPSGPLVIENLHVVPTLTYSPDITKLCFITLKHDVNRVREELSGMFDVVDNTMGVSLTDCAEILQKGVSKATGLKAVIKYYNASIEESVAFGDGANDFEIIKESGFGVAMENASSELKAVSDFVTGHVEKTGISDALKYLKIID